MIPREKSQSIEVWLMRSLCYSLFFAVVCLGVFFVWNSRSTADDEGFNRRSFNHEFVVAQAHQLMGFNLVDPEQAPPEIRDSVMRGCHLMMQTGFYAPEYSHNELSCTNCHFLGGDTIGGMNGGISLVGVTTTYPQFSKRSGKTISLRERIQNCFQRSMNGKAPPLDSKIMDDLVNYLTWISKEVKSIKEIPWLGLPDVESKHKPDAKEGRKIYEECCAVCHRSDGAGGGVLDEIEKKTIPPLWGSHSFNDGAGMCTISMLAPFIFLNMPYQQARLTEEQALDVAAYVIEQQRPHFSK